jgi:NAD(P) transhydrogenase subunit alpha
LVFIENPLHQTYLTMKFGIAKETAFQRVAVIPDTIAKFQDLGLEVLVESGAGEQAFFDDQTYTDAGATIVDRAGLLGQSDLLVSIAPLADSDLKQVPKEAFIISQFAPFQDDSVVDKLRSMGLQAFSMDMIPRTTLAQSMDVLSSMASVAGYRSVLAAAGQLPRYFPMLITAAGSIRPAKVLVLGAGVAGLQAIATARRLGAMVEAFDTRQAAKEEVQSLGAKFVEVEGAKDDTSAGGYAVEQSEEFLKRQRAEVQARAQKSDVIITTAQVRGRKAPILVPTSTVEQMKPGSVIVDLAASTGGNCELTQDEQTIVHKGVSIIGNSNLADLMPQDASQLYSNNVYNFLKHLVREGQVHLDLEDEIIGGAFITPSPQEQTS